MNFVTKREIDIDVISTTPLLILQDILLSIGGKQAQSHNGCAIFSGDFGKYSHIVIQKVDEYKEDDGNETFSIVAQDFPHALFVRLRTDEK